MPEVRFCSACGAELSSQPPVACSSCGTKHWRNPKPCANAIVIEHGKVLLVQRAQAPWKDAWCAPGGFCDAGEHPIETVEREALEETGLRVAVTGYIGVWVDDYVDELAAPTTDVINVAYYTAVPLGGPEGPVDETEVSELRWFARDELPRALAPPRTLSAVLAAANMPMPVRDRPTTARTPPS